MPVLVRHRVEHLGGRAKELGVCHAGAGGGKPGGGRLAAVHPLEVGVGHWRRRVHVMARGGRSRRIDGGGDVIVPARLRQAPPEAAVLRELLHHGCDHLGGPLRLGVVRDVPVGRCGHSSHAGRAGTRRFATRGLWWANEAGTSPAAAAGRTSLGRRRVLGRVSRAVEVLLMLMVRVVVLRGPPHLVVARHGIDVLAVDGDVQVVEGVEAEKSVVAARAPNLGNWVAAISSDAVAASASAATTCALVCGGGDGGGEGLSRLHGALAADTTGSSSSAVEAALGLQPAVPRLATAVVVPLVASSSQNGMRTDYARSRVGLKRRRRRRMGRGRTRAGEGDRRGGKMTLVSVAVAFVRPNVGRRRRRRRGRCCTVGGGRRRKMPLLLLLPCRLYRNVGLGAADVRRWVVGGV